MIQILVFFGIILFIYFWFILQNRETFNNQNNIEFGATMDHLEIAYQLCAKDSSRNCRKYIQTYEKLRNLYHKMKIDYCNKNPNMCEKLKL
jgi:hypothetical protein